MNFSQRSAQRRRRGAHDHSASCLTGIHGTPERNLQRSPAECRYARNGSPCAEQAKTWQLRPPALARELSREGGKRVGRAKLKRMFDEAIVAGYMARSVAQTHTDGGLWGPYVYFMGMPEDVAAAVKREGVVVLPHAKKPHTVEPHTVEPHAANQQAYKRKNLETRDSIKPLPNLPLFAGSNGQAIKSPRSIEGR